VVGRNLQLATWLIKTLQIYIDDWSMCLDENKGTKQMKTKTTLAALLLAAVTTPGFSVDTIEPRYLEGDWHRFTKNTDGEPVEHKVTFEPYYITDLVKGTGKRRWKLYESRPGMFWVSNHEKDSPRPVTFPPTRVPQTFSVQYSVRLGKNSPQGDMLSLRRVDGKGSLVLERFLEAADEN
jgi:hypothetical protein